MMLVGVMKDVEGRIVYTGTVDACWINRMLVGCQVQNNEGVCNLLKNLDIG